MSAPSPEVHARYNASPKGRTRYARYRASGAAREAQRRYAASSAGRMKRNHNKRDRMNDKDRAKLQELVNLLTEGS